MTHKITITLNPIDYIPTKIHGIENFTYDYVYTEDFIKKMINKYDKAGITDKHGYYPYILEYFQAAARIMAGCKFFSSQFSHTKDIRGELNSLRNNIDKFDNLHLASFDALVRCSSSKVIPYSFFDAWLAQGRGLSRQEISDYYISLPHFKNFVRSCYSQVTINRLITITLSKLEKVKSSNLADKCIDNWVYFLVAVYNTFWNLKVADNRTQSPIKVAGKEYNLSYIHGISEFLFDCYSQAHEKLELLSRDNDIPHITTSLRKRIDYHKLLCSPFSLADFQRRINDVKLRF